MHSIAQGEDIAIDYLRRKGYVILDRNWRSGHREIDIVARKDDTVVFVEVKARANAFYGNPRGCRHPQEDAPAGACRRCLSALQRHRPGGPLRRDYHHRHNWETLHKTL